MPGFVAQCGKRLLHLFDYIFGAWDANLASAPVVGFSQSQENRAWLKETFLRNLWSETMLEKEAHESIRLVLRGVLSRDELLVHLEAHGFEVLAWEDRSDAMKHIAGQLILSHGSMCKFWSRSEPAVAPLDLQVALGRAGLGYYPLVTQKKIDLCEDAHEKTL